MRVIPVLVDGARPLQPQQLPAELQKLARLNALELSYDRYELTRTDCLTSSSRCWPLPPRMLAPASLTGIPVTWRCGRARRKLEGRRYGPRHTDVERREETPSRSPTRAEGRALTNVAEALTATDPDRAERIAQSITDEYWKAIALAKSRRRWRPPTRTARRTHRPVDHRRGRKAVALARVAEALAATDPDRAERIAQSITNETRRPTRSPRSRRRWRPPTRTAPNASPSPSPTSTEGRRAHRGRGGAGRHRPGPRRTHRPVDHDEDRKAEALARGRGGAGRDRPGPCRTAARRERIAQSITDEA